MGQVVSCLYSFACRHSGTTPTIPVWAPGPTMMTHAMMTTSTVTWTAVKVMRQTRKEPSCFGTPVPKTGQDFPGCFPVFPLGGLRTSPASRLLRLTIVPLLLTYARAVPCGDDLAATERGVVLVFSVKLLQSVPVRYVMLLTLILHGQGHSHQQDDP